MARSVGDQSRDGAVMITALIPCFNAEPFIAETIASVRAQTRPVDEILVVDDCSTDGSKAIAESLGATVLQTAVNSGHAVARNIGLRSARGDLIAWLDADDYWEANHIETVAGLLERFPEADVAFSAVRFTGDREGTVWSTPSTGRPANRFWDCVTQTIVPANTALTRRAPLLAIGGFAEDIRTAPDFDFWLRLSRHHLFVNTEEVTCNYRWHASQISRRPELQVQSLYESRWRYLQSVQLHDDEGFQQAFRQRMTAIWDEHLQSAWQRRDLKRLRFLLGLRRFVPGTTETARRLRWRAHIPELVLRGWDAIT